MISPELPSLKLTVLMPVKIGQPPKKTSIQQPSIFLDVLKVDEKKQDNIPHMVF